MTDCRFPRRAQPSRDALDRLRAAWNWASKADPAVKEIASTRPSLAEIPVDGAIWVIQGLMSDGGTVHACIGAEGQLNVMRSAPGPWSPMAHIRVDLPEHLQTPSQRAA
jgi:hypothetical protein